MVPADGITVGVTTGNIMAHTCTLPLDIPSGMAEDALFQEFNALISGGDSGFNFA